MTRAGRPSDTTETLDDDAIGRLVRDAAEGWTMPAVRLDAPPWRDRIRGPRGRRVAAARGWLGRVGQAASAAVALTVVGALVAVTLTRPPAHSGTSPAPSRGETPGSSSAPASALPKLLVNGDPPRPSAVVVATESGDFARVDLTTGIIGSPMTGASDGSRLVVFGDGSSACLCVARRQFVHNMPTQMSVTLVRFAADGTRGAETAIETFTGTPDPRDAGSTQEVLNHVDVAIDLTTDGRYGFVGWSLRAPPVWKGGLIVIDLAQGSIASRLELPDSTTGEGDARRLAFAPRVIEGDASGERLLARTWVEWRTPRLETVADTTMHEIYRTGLTRDLPGNPALLPFGTDCGEAVLRGSLLRSNQTWLECLDQGAARITVRRFAPDATTLGDTSAARAPGIDGDTSALSADGRMLFAWDPSSATLARISVETGEKNERQAGTASTASDPLAALGRWLAPSTFAKSILRGAIVLSPDGTRIYAIGTGPGTNEHEPTGSAGVFVFDTGTLELLGHWAATADLVSLAISADGQFLYAAGLPGVDASGARTLAQGASITVYSTADGSVRLVAGQLGQGLLTFTAPVLE